MKRIILKYFFWILTVGIMVAIFCFSAQGGDESLSVSESFTEKILSSFQSFRRLSEERQTEIVEGIQTIVRKTAHFSVYAMLGVSMLSAFYLTFKGNLLSLYALIGCLLYAISDEIHQYFVPGRSGEVRDVIIDTLGALLGILLVIMIKHLISRKKVYSKK